MRKKKYLQNNIYINVALYLSINSASSTGATLLLHLVFSNYFWPDYDELEWIKIEIKLKNLILETFTKKNSIDYRKYTQNEIRDIIFNNKSSLKNDYLDILQNSNTNFKIHSFKDSMNRNIKVNIKTGSYDTNYVSISNWKFGSYLQMKKKISNFKVKVYFQKKPKKYFINNVIGTLNILEASRRIKIKKFIYAASSSCYGNPKFFPTS